MKKARLIAGMTAAIPAAAGGFAAPAAAHAATAAAQVQPAKGKTVLNHATIACTNCGPGWYQVINGTLYSPGGAVLFPNPYSGSVHVTCYYKGNTGFPHDPYFDHFVSKLYPNGRHPTVGHVADQYVDLGNHLPTSFGIPHC
jgi:hypothetical protein